MTTWKKAKRCIDVPVGAKVRYRGWSAFEAGKIVEGVCLGHTKIEGKTIDPFYIHIRGPLLLNGFFPHGDYNRGERCRMFTNAVATGLEYEDTYIDEEYEALLV